MSFKISNIYIPNNTVLAPMAGVNCTSFRLQCKKYGCGLLFTQMYKVSTIIEKYNEDKTGNKLKSFLNIINNNEIGESPIAIQLVGSIKDNWKQCIEILNKNPIKDSINLIDINFGCPEKDIHAINSGGYLMKSPENIKIIAKICVQNSKIPITAKIRSGWDEKSINALDVSKILIKENVSAITIHPRTVLQKYGGKADWTIIKKVKNYCIENKINTPIIGNGDITLPGHAKAIMEQTKCDAIMIGRAAMKDPQMFERINYIIENGKNKEEYTKDSKNPIKLIKEFIELYINYENRKSTNELKNHAQWLLTETKEKNIIAKKISKCNTIEEIKKLFY